MLSFQAWRILPAKIAEVMEELKAVEVPALYWPGGFGPPRPSPKRTAVQSLPHPDAGTTECVQVAQPGWPHRGPGVISRQGLCCHLGRGVPPARSRGLAGLSSSHRAQVPRGQH